jgi:hypothetical protein
LVTFALLLAVFMAPPQFNTVSVRQRDNERGRAAHQEAPPGPRYNSTKARRFPSPRLSGCLHRRKYRQNH